MSAVIVRLDTNESLRLDATPNQSHSPEIKVTSHTVEDKADVTDHAEEKLESFTVTGIVTAMPFVRVPEQKPERPEQAARDFFKRATEKKLAVDTTRFGIIEPCLLERYPHSPTREGYTQFRLGFKVVRFAEATEVAIPPEVSQDPSLSSEKDVGTQSTEVREVLGTDDDPQSVFFDSDQAQEFKRNRTFQGEGDTDADVGQSWGVSLVGG